VNEAGGRRPVELPAVTAHTGAQRGLRGRGLLTLILVLTLVWSLLQVDWSDGLLRSNGLSALGNLLSGIVQPDLSARMVQRVLRATWITVVYAVAGMTVALILGFTLGILSSGVLAGGRAAHLGLVTGGRGLLAAMRAIHELVWAWLFVVAIGLSPFAAIFAIAVPYAGILGRIYADLLNDVPQAPLRALRANGASEVKTLLYGRLPMAMPDMVAYSYYRFECALRASAIMGFVGLGGLGFEIQIALADLNYQAAGTSLLALIVLIAAVEAWSSVVRRELVR
jgi:phosphonate transport system permease protein